MRQWCDIAEWPGYQVSDDGKVRNAKTKRILYVDFDRFGYCRVKLSNQGLQKNKRIHVLVAQAFLDWYPGCDVDHIDRDKENNKLQNLRIMSHQENCMCRSRGSDWYAELEQEPAPF